MDPPRDLTLAMVEEGSSNSLVRSAREKKKLKDWAKPPRTCGRVVVTRRPKQSLNNLKKDP